ncbi:hypothetical protein ElyMa_003321200 [Elysia marginata]|uniref:Uncharacterized protein n=1 Tax=Elysia marginata TaxID=1093978 RepID=A0AAV4JFS7_9GAST|nr:hypothetical protein ElyMa_003321200 [Elysia marginata]
MRGLDRDAKKPLSRSVVVAPFTVALYHEKIKGNPKTVSCSRSLFRWVTWHASVKKKSAEQEHARNQDRESKRGSVPLCCKEEDIPKERGT